MEITFWWGRQKIYKILKLKSVFFFLKRKMNQGKGVENVCVWRGAGCNLKRVSRTGLPEKIDLSKNLMDVNVFS